MSTACNTSNEYHGCSSRDCCARQRKRLLLVQKRLDLEKERLGLDRELLEAEKAIFKKSVKLAAKHKYQERIEQNRNQFREQQEEIQKLRAQLNAFQKNEKDRVRKEAPEGAEGADSSSQKQRYKILNLEKELQKIKGEHKILKKKHNQEKENWEKEKLESIKADLSVDLSRKMESVTLQLEKLEAENNALRKEKLSLKKSFEPLSKIVSIEKQPIGADILHTAIAKFEGLRAERDMLETKLREKSRQIDDWKLLLPRNKALLEKTLSKNKQLFKQLEDSKNRNDSKPRTEPKEVEQENENSKKNVTNDMDTVCLENSSTKMLSTMTSSPSVGANKILIPSDWSSDELKNHDKKFVIEWVWANDENGLGGLFTGWLDLGGRPSGHGTLRIDDGGIYIGEWKEGRRNGHGVYTSVDGAIYSGPWLNDKFQGRGVFVSDANQVYTGDWENGLRHGYGIETWANGARYTGCYHSGKRNGAFL